MTLLLIIFCILGASALIRSAREKRAAEKAQRIANEQARIKREMREMRQQANEEVAARIALEREQMRQRREQERLAQEQRDAEAKAEREREKQMKLWEKQRKEDERRDAQLAKHEKRISDLELKVRKLDRDIKREYETLADYYAQLDWLLLQQSGTTPSGKEFAGWQNKIVAKNNQIRKVEGKIEDMKDAKEKAQREMVA